MRSKTDTTRPPKTKRQVNIPLALHKSYAVQASRLDITIERLVEEALLREAKRNGFYEPARVAAE